MATVNGLERRPSLELALSFDIEAGAIWMRATRREDVERVLALVEEIRGRAR